MPTPIPPITYQSTTAGVIYYDPFGLLFLLLFALSIIALAVYIFTAITDIRNSSRTNDAQVNALNSQTNNMNNLVQAVVAALNVNNALYERQVQHNIDTDNRILRMAELYTTANINFMQNLQNMLMMQTVYNDISQLQNDRLKAQIASKLTTPEIEIIEYPPPQPQAQAQAQPQAQK